MNEVLRFQTVIKILVVGLLLFMLPGLTQAQDEEPATLRNPLNAYGGADPWLVFYEGNYYLTTTTWTSELLMRRSPTLAGLKTAVPLQIYAETDPSRCCNMWAPEFHLLEGPNGPRWYYYYSAGTSGTNDNQRSHVLESAGTDPMGPYTYKGRLYDPANDVWAIDGSILRLDDELYFLFSSWVGPNQALFIAPMSDPWTLSGPRVLIAQPEYDWERSGLNVTEGPVALYHEDKTFIIYSASFCGTPDYKLGMLTYNGGNPLSAASWDKHPEPVFQQSADNGVFGPAHNGFFQSPDGTEDWIVYHANDAASDGCDDGRTTRVQRFTWNADGTPNFGTPVATTEVIPAPAGDTGPDPVPEFAQLPVARFESVGIPGAYLRHIEAFTRFDLSIVPLADSQFYVLPGLADPAAVSLVPVNFPGHYMRHENNAILFQANDGAEGFAADATWWLRPGLADDGAISFEAYSQPNHYIGRLFGVAALVEITDATPEQARADATFWEER